MTSAWHARRAGIRRAGNRCWSPTSDSIQSNSGNHFVLLADMSGIPNTELRDNQMECDDLDVKVDLPRLGLTDALPSRGEAVLGDICIATEPAATPARATAGTP